MHLVSLFSLNLPLYEHKKRPSFYRATVRYYIVVFKILGAFINCGTWVLQGELSDLSIFHSFQTVDVFSTLSETQFLVLNSNINVWRECFSVK